MKKRKFFFVTTIPSSLSFFIGQYQILKKDYDITAISSQHEQLNMFGIMQEINVHFIPMEREISLLKDLYGLLCFIIYFLYQRPYIVHGNTPKGSLLSMFAAWITRVPVRIYMCHGLRYQGFTGFKRKLLMFMERISCFCATDIMCVSNGVKNVLKRDRITKKEPIIIWNGSVSGIDVEKFNPDKNYDRVALRSKCRLQETDFVLTFVGRLVKDKGIDELVRAYKELNLKYSNMKLLLVGPIESDGNPISEETKNEIKENKGIISVGRQYDIPSYLAISDLFVFPSYREGFGLSLMEAGAMGVPSISSDITGCNEVIIEGENGLLIPSHSFQAIIEAVEYLYTNKSLYNKLKQNSRNSIIRRFEQKKLFNLYREYYVSK